jgi:hypothetical protein
MGGRTNLYVERVQKTISGMDQLNITLSPCISPEFKERALIFGGNYWM